MDHAAGRFCEESIGENEVMERLTEKHYLGTGHYMKCSGNCNVDMDCIDCPSFDRLVERLAAYEDTGLAPEQLTTADVVPVVHGRWENCFEDWRQQIEGSKCSACGFEYYGTGISRFRYCPNCGAKMDGGGDNEM